MVHLSVLLFVLYMLVSRVLGRMVLAYLLREPLPAAFALLSWMPLFGEGFLLAGLMIAHEMGRLRLPRSPLTRLEDWVIRRTDA